MECGMLKVRVFQGSTGVVVKVREGRRSSFGGLYGIILIVFKLRLRRKRI